MELLKIKTLLWRERKGFSVVELLITAAIGLIALGMVSTLYFTSNRSFTSGQTSLHSEADLRLAMDWIARDAREAESIDTVALQVFLDGKTITFGFEDNQLTRTVSGEPTRPIGPVTIDSLNASGSTVMITLRPVVGDTNRTLTTKVTMRNAE